MQIDHVVLWVSDPLRSLDFYQHVLGLEPVRREEYAAGEAAFPSVRISDASILDLMDLKMSPLVEKMTASDGAAGPVNHVCLAMSAGEYDALVARLDARSIALRPGPEASFGARGISRHSGYLADPDGNILEIRHYE